jgi:predicted RNase H-like HicB family nuclease
MEYVYPACFYPEDDERVSVVFADFDLATFGGDLADAMSMAADAAAGRILAMIEDGENLPKPSQTNNVKPEDPKGFVSLVYINLDNLKSLRAETPVTKTRTLPSWLNKAAKKKNINFSAALKDALIEKIAQ